MDTSTIIIAILMLSICIVPFLLLKISKNKQKQKALQTLQILANNSQSKISQFDTWLQTTIGIDDAGTHLFFHSKGLQQETSIPIDLRNIHTCKIQRISSGNNSIQKLALQLIPFDKNSKPFELLFYTSEGDTYINNEVLLIEKWHTIICNNL